MLISSPEYILVLFFRRNTSCRHHLRDEKKVVILPPFRNKIVTFLLLGRISTDGFYHLFIPHISILVYVYIGGSKNSESVRPDIH